MRLQPFYQINPSAYIFTQKHTPEEQVRQWLLYELLSTYGFHIHNITFEYKVRVGSKIYRADIVVLHKQKPYIVVECKQYKIKNLDNGIEQAKTYAEMLKAPLIICTNGAETVFLHKYHTNWHIITDLPQQRQTYPTHNIDQLFDNIQLIKSFMKYYQQEIKSTQAAQFFDQLQRLIVGSTAFNDVEHQLHTGSELLLRGLVCQPFSGNHYAERKIGIGLNSLVRYFIELGYTRSGLSEANPAEFNIDERASAICACLQDLHHRNNEMYFADKTLLHMIEGLLNYLINIRSYGNYLDIPPELAHDIHAFIAPRLRREFGIVLTYEEE